MTYCDFKMIKERFKPFARYLRQTSGAIIIAFAIVTPIVMGAMGMALDFSRAYLVQQRLAQALDAAALAAASSSSDPATIEQKVKDFFDANYPEEELGVTFEPVVEVDGDVIRVSGVAKYYTTFMSLLGIDEMEVDAYTEVVREVSNLEVAMVLDVTGSMASNNNIGALRTASTNFVNILYENARNPDSVKVALIPYSTAVNVGPYGLGKDIYGDNYGDAFVNNPDDLEYDQWDDREWHGCVEALNYPNDEEDSDGPWDMYEFDCTNWGFCDWYNQNQPNLWCNKSHIIPLTNDQDLLLDEIDDFQAEGSTLANLGMVWGYRVLSPEFPFEEGVQWNDTYTKKAVVMMTDGQNFINDYYTAYGITSENSISVHYLNERFASVCETLKDDHNVIIYTVTFAGGVDQDTKDYYKNCATTEAHYYDAPDQSDLIDVFEEISTELSNLRIQG